MVKNRATPARMAAFASQVIARAGAIPHLAAGRATSIRSSYLAGHNVSACDDVVKGGGRSLCHGIKRGINIALATGSVHLLVDQGYNPGEGGGRRRGSTRS